MLTEYEKGFLEGAIDADGCITIVKCKSSRHTRGWKPLIHLQIGNNNSEYLEKIRNIIGGGGINRYTNNRGRKMWVYVLSHSKCKKLFPHLKLIVKEPRRLHAMKIFNYMANKSLAEYRSDEYTQKLEMLINTRPLASVDDANARDDVSN